MYMILAALCLHVVVVCSLLLCACYTESVADEETRDARESAELQDPFSFEELNMALMTTSKIKGNNPTPFHTFTTPSLI